MRRAAVALIAACLALSASAADDRERRGNRRTYAGLGPPVLVPSSAAVVGGSNQEISCGVHTALNNVAAATWCWTMQCGSSGCNAGGTELSWVRRMASNQNSFRLASTSNGFTFGLFPTITGSALLHTATAVFPQAVEVYHVCATFNGGEPAEADRVKAYVISGYHAIQRLPLSDPVGTNPTTLPASTAPLVFFTSSVPINVGWFDDFLEFAGVELSPSQICNLYGGTVIGGLCYEGERPFELRNVITDLDYTGPDPVAWYTFGERGDSTTSFVNRMGGSTPGCTCTAGDGACTGAVSTTLTARLPRLSPLNRPDGQTVNREVDTLRIRKWRGGPSVPDAKAAIELRNYYMQPKLYLKDQLRCYGMMNGGIAHGNDSHFLRHFLSKNNCDTFGIEGSTDYPFSPSVELWADLTDTDITTGAAANGDRGSQCTCFSTRSNDQQGVCLCTWNSVSNSASPPQRRICGMWSTAASWHADLPTYTLSSPACAEGFFEARAALWVSQAAARGFESFAGNKHLFSYQRDGGDNYRIEHHRCGAADDCTVLASWDEHFSVENGQTLAINYDPEEPVAVQVRGGPNHGRVILCIRTDSNTLLQGGFQAGRECSCTWSDNIDDPTPTWAVRGVSGSKFDWTVASAIACGNTPTFRVNVDHSLTLFVRGESDAFGDMTAYGSTNYGASWSSFGVLTEGQDQILRSVNIADQVEIYPRNIIETDTREMAENGNNATWTHSHINPDLVPAGPMTLAGWTDTGALRVNDAGATDEQVILGRWRATDGKDAVTIKWFTHATAPAGDSALLNHWEAADADQGWITRLRSNGRIELVVANGATDCVMTSDNGAWTSGLHHVAVVYVGGGSPTAAIYVDGVAVANACDSGALPTTWPTPVAGELRIGLHYDGSEPCSTCYFNEIANYHYAASSVEIEADAASVNDPRYVPWTFAIGPRTHKVRAMQYYPLNGAAGLGLLDSPSNNRVLDYGMMVTPQVDGDGVNLEAGDYGATIP